MANATYTHTLQLSTGATLTFTQTLTDTNAQRIINAYKEILEMSPGATFAQVWTALATGVFNGIKNNTKGQELANQEAAIVITNIT